MVQLRRREASRGRTISVTVLVYRAEAGYFAHIHGWRSTLARDLTRKYWDSSDDDKYLFASDEAMDGFWRDLDDDGFGERFALDIDPNSTTSQLIRAATERASGRTLVRRGLHQVWKRERLYGMFHLTSGQKLENGSQLADYDVDAGDLFGLILEYPPRAAYSILPLPDAAAVFDAIRSVDEKPPAGPSSVVVRGFGRALPDPVGDPLLGALLYTDEDIGIASYVRKHFASLSEASGPSLQLYVIEQPESQWREASRYWKGVIDEQLQRDWTTLGWLRTKPYDTSQAYAVARRLGIFPDQLPCLVVFDHLEQADKLVFPLSASAGFFRALFSSLQRLIESESTRELAFTGVRRNYPAILDALQEHAIGSSEDGQSTSYEFYGQTVFINRPGGRVTLTDFQNRPPGREKIGMSEQFTFHGTTTFINRPRDTVIRDFQNTYIKHDGSQADRINTELAKLVETLLQSRDLPEPDKEEAVAAVHNIAEEVRDGKSNRLTMKGTLETVRHIAGKAIDIAAPVATIVATALAIAGVV